MIKRVKSERGGDYFPERAVEEEEGNQFIHSGCTLLDRILGGGWPLGRIVNIVGDKATGKTLLAIEAAANFSQQYPDGKIWYRESEAAFDVDYAETLGLPAAKVDFGPEGIDTLWETVEAVFIDLQEILKGDPQTPGLYIIDSLDALSSEAELNRKPGEGSYGLEKQKMLGLLFRHLVRRVKKANICFMFVSQVRDKIGVVFGDKHTRTGGRALDFYASQIVWLSHTKTLTREIHGVKRAIADLIRAKTKKNKMAPPHQECEFKIRYGYGIADLDACLDWLDKTKHLSEIGLSPSQITSLTKRAENEPEVHAEWIGKAREHVFKIWEEVNQDFAPKRRKYSD